MTGFHQVERVYPDQVITDNFLVLRKQWEDEDSAGNCYDRYEIDKHYRVVDKTKGIKDSIGNAAQSALEVAALNFVVNVQAGVIDATTAGEHAELFLEWSENSVSYKVDEIRRDPLDGALYQVVQAHTSQPGWNPSLLPALWKRFADPSEEWPEWSQPYAAFDAYRIGAKCTRLGKHYVNDIDYNDHPPEVLNSGWHEAQEGE